MMSSELHNPGLSSESKRLYNETFSSLLELGYDVGVRLASDVWGPSPLANSLEVQGLANGRYYVLIYWDGSSWRIGTYHSDDKAAQNGIIMSIVDTTISNYDFVEFLNTYFAYLDGKNP